MVKQVLALMHIRHIERHLIARIVHMDVKNIQSLERLIVGVDLRPDVNSATLDVACRFLLVHIAKAHVGAHTFVSYLVYLACLLVEANMIILKRQPCRPDLHWKALTSFRIIADKQVVAL